jgi:hypothetical protein
MGGSTIPNGHKSSFSNICLMGVAKPLLMAIRGGLVIPQLPKEGGLTRIWILSNPLWIGEYLVHD